MNTVTTHDVYGHEYRANLSDLTQTIRVYAIIIRDSQLLLTKQWDGYSLPGGGVELGEHLEDTLERELKEETGLDIKAGNIFYGTDRLFQRDAASKPVQAMMFFYDAAEVSGEISNQDITESEKTYTTGKAEWIPLEELRNITYRHSVALDEILKQLTRPAIKEVVETLDEIAANVYNKTQEVLGGYIIGATLAREDIDTLLAVYPSLETIADYGSDLEVYGESQYTEHTFEQFQNALAHFKSHLNS